MASTDSDSEDAITKDEIAGSAPAPVPSPATALETDTSGHGTKRNAFTELMSPRTKIPAQTPAAAAAAAAAAATTTSTSPTSTTTTRTRPHTHRARDGLSAYTDAPEAYPGSRVIFHSADFVAIHDLYPKASVHALLLPRSAALRRLHPFDALGEGNAGFLAAVREQAARLKGIVAKELQRRFGACSALDAPREAVLDGREEEEETQQQQQQQGEEGEEGKMKNKEQKGTTTTTTTTTSRSEDGGGSGGGSASLPALPPGRDWEAEVLVGVHAHPSMNDLHVHVLSRDMRSECLRHRKHYNSFNTPFLVPLDDFPLAADDPRRHPGREREAQREGEREGERDGEKRGYLGRDLRCWRCGRNFGNRFKALKEHLEAEWEEWKRV